MFKFIEGNMIEGGRITAEINGERIKRVVRYNHMDGLYIVYRGSKLFEYECDYSDYYKTKDREVNNS